MTHCFSLTLVASASALALLVLARTSFAEPGADKAGTGQPTQTLARYPVDEAELKRLEDQRPHVADLLERAESEAIAGRPTEALGLLDEAVKEFPFSPLVNRRKCQVLTMLGRRVEAADSCRAAVEASPTPLALRAMIRAYLEGGPSLSASDLHQALIFATTEQNRRPMGLWGYALLSQIAERIGDEAMLEYCAAELLRVAPDDAATRHVLALLRPRWWVTGAWLAIVAAILGTLGHIVWSAFRKVRGRSTSAVLAGVLALATAAAPSSARADTSPPAPSAIVTPRKPPQTDEEKAEEAKKWTINDDDPASNIPGEGLRNRNPLAFANWLGDVADRGAKASKLGDHDKAIKYFKALAIAVPDSAPPFAKLCEEYEALGRREDGITACALALLREGVRLDDYDRYVRLVVGRPGRLSDKDLATLLDVVDHVRKDPDAGELPAERLTCDIGIKTQDAKYLGECSAMLSKAAPNDPKAIAYQWSLAMVDHRYDEAWHIIARAKAAGYKDDSIAEMEGATKSELQRRHMFIMLAAASIALLLAAAVIITLIVRRRRSGSPPSPPRQATPAIS
jgi:tetratricopeptide (TPR) repeat protein